MSITSTLTRRYPTLKLVYRIYECWMSARGKNGVKIYLTFDDGPSSLTPRLLKILKRHNVKATFFIVKPWVKDDVLKRIVEEGHSVGLHSYSHVYSQIYSSEDAFMSDLKRLEDYFVSVTGLTTRLYRFPGGRFNTVSEKYCPGIMASLIPKLLAEGWQIFDWNCDNEDREREHLNSKTYFSLGVKSILQCRSNHKIFLSHNRDNDISSLGSIPFLIIFFKCLGCVFDTLDHYPVNPKDNKVVPELVPDGE